MGKDIEPTPAQKELAERLMKEVLNAAPDVLRYEVYRRGKQVKIKEIRRGSSESA